MAGGGQSIYASAIPVLPSYFDSDYFTKRDSNVIVCWKEEMENIALNWTSEQRLTCLKEVPTAFDMNMNLLYDRPDSFKI